MSLVKTSKRNLPSLGEAFLTKDPFFADLFDSRRGLFNLNRLFNVDNGSFEFPAINVKDNEKNVELELAAPGLSKDDFDITIDNDVLTISSEKEDKKEEEENGYMRKEFSYSSFSRSFSLPDSVDENKEVKATYHDGILKLVLQKREGIKPKSPKSVKVS